MIIFEYQIESINHSESDSEKQDLIQKQKNISNYHRPNKSKTEILSTTDTPFSGEIITPKTPIHRRYLI